MSPSGHASRIIQIHPSRRCNLQCLHCYSASGPTEREQLDPEVFTQLISDASFLGYDIASFSGGEPTLYPHLRLLLDQAHRHQMKTVVVSNGMLLTEQRLEALAGAIDILAISLDGMPETHNQMRNHPAAFETMVSRLPAIRDAGIPFGFIFTLTYQNYQQFDWVVDFALEQGASLLQIHPLEGVGRAQSSLQGIVPNASLAAYAYLKTNRLRDSLAKQQLFLQLDLIHQQYLLMDPQRFYAHRPKPDGEVPLSELISPLVVEPDGTVVPLQYGFSRHYGLGNLKQAQLPALAKTWQQQIYPDFLNLCQQVYTEMSVPQELPIFDWYGAVTDRAASTSLVRS
jgi:MoaA/NifB/PqqE/SkfB family radical SAM enzyme